MVVRLLLILILGLDWAAADGLVGSVAINPTGEVWAESHPVLPMALRYRQDISDRIRTPRLAFVLVPAVDVAGIASTFRPPFQEQDPQSLPEADSLYWFMSLRR